MKKKVIGYVRVSTDKQDYESQKRELRLYAERSGFDLVTSFEDTISWMIRWEEREGFVKMLKYIQDNEDVRTVAVDEISRLGRDVAEQYATYRELKRLGVEIHTKWRGRFDANSKEDDLMFSILSWMAQYERGLIIDRTGRGRREVLETGHTQLSRKIFGYDIVKTERDGKKVNKRQTIKINEEEAEVVRRLFEMAGEWRSTTYLRSWLSKEGIKPVLGGEIWPKSTILKILHAETYKGKWIWGKKYGTDKTNPKRRIEVNVPAIISADLFEKVQGRLKKTKTIFNPKKSHENKFLLKGILFNHEGKRFQTHYEGGVRKYRDPGRNLKSPLEEGKKLSERKSSPSVIDANFIEENVVYHLSYLIEKSSFFEEEKKAIADWLKEKGGLEVIEKKEKKARDDLKKANMDYKDNLLGLDRLKRLSPAELSGELELEVWGREENKKDLAKEIVEIGRRLNELEDEKRALSEREQSISELERLEEGLLGVASIGKNSVSTPQGFEELRIMFLKYVEKVEIREHPKLTGQFRELISEIRNQKGIYSVSTPDVIRQICHSTFSRDGRGKMKLKKMGPKILEITITYVNGASSKFTLNYWHQSPFFFSPSNFDEACSGCHDSDHKILVDKILRAGQSYYWIG